MNDPVNYNKYNQITRQDVKEILEEYSSEMKWKIMGDRVCDIGSGDGAVTVQLLGEILPYNYSKLVGMDKSEKMVQFANEKYRTKNTYFVKLDIEEEIPEDFLGSFDHVFSFYTLHWIRKQKAAVRNMYNLLSAGGDCLLSLIACTPLFAVYRILAQSPKWAHWLVDAEDYISPFQDSLEPEKEYRVIFEEVGFKNVFVKCQNKTFHFPGPDSVENLKGLIAAVSPFKIPKGLLEEYLKDFVQTGVNHKFMEEITDDNGELAMRYSYKLIVAYGSKSSNNNL